MDWAHTLYALGAFTVLLVAYGLAHFWWLRPGRVCPKCKAPPYWWSPHCPVCREYRRPV